MLIKSCVVRDCHRDRCRRDLRVRHALDDVRRRRRQVRVPDRRRDLRRTLRQGRLPRALAVPD